MTKLLILSPYDGFSHGFWRDGLAAFLSGTGSQFDVTQCTLPPRYFSWRQRGNSLAFAMKPTLQQPFDLIIATSMTDLSALRGLNRHLALIPAIAYFHENQFAYPGGDSPDDKKLGLVERQITSIYTAISADAVFFNSEFNRATFLEGATQLLAKMPDEVPTGIITDIRKKSSIVPVALDFEQLVPPRAPGSGLRIAWNHRWEHDKGPDRLNEIVDELLSRKARFTLSLFGQQFSRRPPVFDQILEKLHNSHAIGEVGFVEDRSEYLAKLRDHTFVLSTADQEFQGLSVQEAIANGCIPVVPDALCYPEYVPATNRYKGASEAADIILGQPVSTLPDLSRYHWQAIGPVWLSKLAELCPESLIASGSDDEANSLQPDL